MVELSIRFFKGLSGICRQAGRIVSLLLVGPIFAVWIGCATPAAAGYDDGAAAFIRGDYETAWREWLTLGKRGHQSAQYNLGVLYSIGLGVTQDQREAVKWFRRAADRGLPAAQMRLGTAYREGSGVPEDLQSAYFWYTLAAAHFSLGEQHDQAIAARENAGANLTRAQITEVLKKALVWKPLPQTIAESEKERLIAIPEQDVARQTVNGQSSHQEPGISVSVDSQAGASDTATEAQSGLPANRASNGEPADQASQMAAAGDLPAEPTWPTQPVAPAAPAAGVSAAEEYSQPNASAPAAQETEPSGEDPEAAIQESADLSGPTEPSKQVAVANPEAAKGPSYVVHLSSVQNMDGTKSEWRRLKSHFSDLLGNRELIVRSIEVEGRGTFFRVLAGPFDDYGGAKDVCVQLKAREQYCLAIRLTEDRS